MRHRGLCNFLGQQNQHHGRCHAVLFAAQPYWQSQWALVLVLMQQSCCVVDPWAARAPRSWGCLQQGADQEVQPGLQGQLPPALFEG